MLFRQHFPNVSCEILPGISRKNLVRIINQNIYLFNINEETKKVFSPRPMVSFRNPSKISSYLVRTMLYLLDRVVGSTKCGK